MLLQENDKIQMALETSCVNLTVWFSKWENSFGKPNRKIK